MERVNIPIEGKSVIPVFPNTVQIPPESSCDLEFDCDDRRHVPRDTEMNCTSVRSSYNGGFIGEVRHSHPEKCLPNFHYLLLCSVVNYFRLLKLCLKIYIDKNFQTFGSGDVP